MLFQPCQPVHFDGFESAAAFLSVILAAKVTCSSWSRLCSVVSQVLQQECAVYNWRARLHLSVNETVVIIFLAINTIALLMLVWQKESLCHQG